MDVAFVIWHYPNIEGLRISRTEVLERMSYSVEHLCVEATEVKGKIA